MDIFSNLNDSMILTANLSILQHPWSKLSQECSEKWWEFTHHLLDPLAFCNVLRPIL